MPALSGRARFSFYLITDRTLAPRDLPAACAEALAAADQPGPRVAIQLREKDLGGRELFALACELRKICTRHNALLLINDRIDVALACGADGVHLPADSFSVHDARALLGPSRLVGVSTHQVSEVKAAAEAGADFVVFGPVYPPLSKAGYGPATGVEELKKACEASAAPVYALGGITVERVHEIERTGVAGVAAIGAVFGAPSPADAVRALLGVISRLPV